jgi:hypothetical protein
MTDAVARPNDRLTIQLGEEPRELFMSYNRLNFCVAAMENDPSLLESVMIDPAYSHAMVAAALGNKGADGKFELFDLDTVELSKEQFEEVLEWAIAHVADFFVKRLEGVAKIAKAHQPTMEALKSSLAGFAASDGKTPSAGASA